MLCSMKGLTCLLANTLVLAVLGQSYEDVYLLQQILLANYSPTIRPMLNQTKRIVIEPTFHLISLVDVDEIQQSFVANGFLGLSWRDELLRWDPNDYNGSTSISPDPVSIWRPRMVLINTMDKRDLFKDDYAPLTVLFNGLVHWFPGGLFPATCQLDLKKFPCDTHTCHLQLMPMSMNGDDFEFQFNSGAFQNILYMESGGWHFEMANLSSTPFLTHDGARVMPMLQVDVVISRRPHFWIFTIMLPVMLLCALNVLVFAIPAGSGEKVNFNVAVVLALSVYMGIVSEKLPSNSENMPYFTYYIFFLFIMSVVTCFDAIFIVWLSNLDEKKETMQNESKNVNTPLPTNDGMSDNPVKSPDRDTNSFYRDSSSTMTSNEMSYSQSHGNQDAFVSSLIGGADSKFSKPWKGLLRNLKVVPMDVITDKTLEVRKEKDNYYENLAKKVNLFSFAAFCFINTCITITFVIALTE